MAQVGAGLPWSICNPHRHHKKTWVVWQNKRNAFLTALKAGMPKAKAQEDSTYGRDLLTPRRLSSHSAFHGRKSKCSLWDSFYEGSISMSQSLPVGWFFDIIVWGLRFSAYDFQWEHKWAVRCQAILIILEFIFKDRDLEREVSIFSMWLLTIHQPFNINGLRRSSEECSNLQTTHL